MPKLNQRGVIHFLLPLILVLGLVAGVYLVTSGNPLKLFSKASVLKPASPETSFTLVGTGLNVNLYARSDTEKANLFNAKMIFPKDLVEVKEIKINGSFIKNWIENYYDNNKGEISLIGGVPSPGYQTQQNGEAALMATILFVPKKTGKGSVTFLNSSEIFSNLNNINILTIKRGYDIINPEVKPTPTPTPTPKVTALPTVKPTPTPTPTPKVTAPPLPGIKGDGNKDGKVNLVDMSILFSSFDSGDGATGRNYKAGVDMNNDGKINSVDTSLLRNALIESGIIKK